MFNKNNFFNNVDLNKKDYDHNVKLLIESVKHMVPVLEEFAHQRGHSLYELALAWVISHHEVAVTLTGFDQPEHVEKNLRAIDWKLSTSEIDELDNLTSWWDGSNAIIDSSEPTPRTLAK